MSAQATSTAIRLTLNSAGDNTFDVLTQAVFQWAWQNTPQKSG